MAADNSPYPASFPVTVQRKFDPAHAELALHVTVPQPAAMPTVKEYRYRPSFDEVKPVELSLKDKKSRYESAVFQVALRSIHEALAADRQNIIRNISLVLGIDTLNPATGLPDRREFVAVAVRREQFTRFDLARVVPGATLQHLGALVSKDPFGSVGVDMSAGVRTV